jgi:acyl-CoA synthetase (AMP-forming)/AMP-acid ligase II
MTMRPLDFPPTIPHVVRRGAERFGDREFVVSPQQRLTFADAELRSRRVAKRLLRSGVHKGTHVGLLFPQGPDYVVALFAATRIGAVAVPLSTFLRGPELQRAVRHTDIDTLVAPAALLGRDLASEFEDIWPELRTTTTSPCFLRDAPCLRHVCFIGGTDRLWATGMPPLADVDDDTGIGDDVLAALETEVTPADPMVIVSTSGATGEPKAVVHGHGAQVRHGWRLAQLYEFDGSERTFTTMPLVWVGGLTVVLLSHLHVGAAVLTVERTDSGEMLDLIEQARPTRLVGWTLLERLNADPTFAERDLSSVTDFQPRAAPHLRHNSLGMSETGGPHTAAAASENTTDLPEDRQGSFGPPVPGMQHRIVDPDTGAVLADGVEGEICVRGDSLMLGLYKRERSETFDADGWYRTGDRGFFRDGLLYFTGRNTEMIKTGGANVAPREVELAVESLAGVQAAFVVGIPDHDRGQLVGCLVCPEAGCDVDVDAIRQQLVTRLSSFKVPRRMLVLPYDDAPWLPSGKVNKARVVELLTDRDPLRATGSGTRPGALP